MHILVYLLRPQNIKCQIVYILSSFHVAEKAEKFRTVSVEEQRAERCVRRAPC